jgi:hypothetical protein
MVHAEEKKATSASGWGRGRKGWDLQRRNTSALYSYLKPDSLKKTFGTIHGYMNTICICCPFNENPVGHSLVRSLSLEAWAYVSDVTFS